MKYIVLLCLSATALFASAQKLNPTALKSAEFYNTTIVQIKPVYKSYVTQTATAFKNRKLNADSLRNAIKAPNNSMFGNLTNVDVETLVLLVMQATAKENEEDLRNMLAEIEKNNKKKEALRREEERIKEAAKAAAYGDLKNMTAEMEKSRQRKDSLSKVQSIKNAQRSEADNNKIQIPAYNADQAKRLAAIKKEKDAIDEMSQQDQLMLQQMMEKKRQLETMISNMMKAMGEMQSGISGNLKGS
jgi:hypothetical protein